MTLIAIRIMMMIVTIILAITIEIEIICLHAVGASTAYHLALRGVKPLVIERSKIAAAASGKAGGFLAGGWGSGPTVKMHEVSFDMHERLAEELGVTSYRKIPTLQVSKRFLFVRTYGTRAFPWSGV